METAPPVCIVCTYPATRSCPDCEAAPYCSGQCPELDAPVHKLLCASFASPPPKPESGRHVLGILFSSDATAPSLVWVRLDGFADEDTGISFQEAEVGAFFPDEAATNQESLHTERNSVRDRDTTSMLEIWHASSPAGTTIDKNGCIATLAGGREHLFHDWRGPVLVLAMTRSTGYMVDPGAYKDATAADFRDAVDFLVDYGNDVHGQRVREALETLGDEPQRAVEADGHDGPEATGDEHPDSSTTGKDGKEDAFEMAA
jgi:hypothetical protein